MNLQDKIGRYYKWWYVMYFNATAEGTGLLANIVLQLTGAFETFIITYVWYLGNAEPDLFSYLLIGKIYKSLSDNYIYPSLSNDIITGKITNKLLIPQNFLVTQFISSIGKRASRNLTKVFSALLVTAIALPLLNTTIPFNSYVFALVLFLPLTFVINYFISIIVGSLCFFVRDKRDFYVIDRLYQTLDGFLTGLIIPLFKLPMTEFFTLQPFAWVLHHPMQIYLGKYTTTQIQWIFFFGILWCIILWLISRFIIIVGLKHNESVGL